VRLNVIISGSAENPKMPTEKGLESSVEFTKHLMTLAVAGIAFLATLDVHTFSFAQRLLLAGATLLLGISLAAGLMVWARAAVMLSHRKYSLEDVYLRTPGLINLFAFGLGVAALGAFLVIKLFSIPASTFITD
jgi:hypothetical protein